MKRLLAGVAGIAVMTGVACAQQPFADVPKDHWAYDAVNTLSQRGLIIGYPDGTFGGKRAMTRYEFAVVIARMIPQLEEYIRTQVANAKPGTPQGPDMSAYATKDDLNNYVTKSDFDALSRLVNEFQPELQMLRVDVDNLRKDLNDLKGRVSVLEDEVGRVHITGDATSIARMSSENRDTLGHVTNLTDIDGRPLNRTHNLLEASEMLYDFDLGITGRVSKGITANALLNVGNYLGGFAGAPFSAFSTPPTDRDGFPYGGATHSSLNAEFSAYKAYIEAPISFRPLGLLDLQVGKTGVQFTPYTLKLVDYDDYTDITKTDNGDVIFTGIKGKFHLGRIGVTAYGGTHGTALLQGSQNGDTLQNPAGSGFPVIFGVGNYSPSAFFSYDAAGNVIDTVPEKLFTGLPFIVAPATQSAGVHATIGVPLDGTLGLTYIDAGINNASGLDFVNPGIITGVDVGRAQVYGADLAFKLTHGIGLTGEYSSSDLYARGEKYKVGTGGDIFDGVKNSYRDAWDTRATFGIKQLALSAGYKRIGPYFSAPGAWGEIGRWKNPTNIQGFVGTAGLPVGHRFALSGSYEQYRSVVAGYGADPLASNHDTHIDRYTGGVKFNLTSANHVDLGVENVRTRPGDPTLNFFDKKASETFYNIGLGHSLSDNASIKLLYQIIDYKDHGADFLNNGQDSKGSVAVGQFSVKF